MTDQQQAPPRFDDSTHQDHPAADKLAEVEREIMMRKRVYPREVAAGKMALDVASRRIDLLRAVARDYRKLMDMGGLFGGLNESAIAKAIYEADPVADAEAIDGHQVTPTSLLSWEQACEAGNDQDYRRVAKAVVALLRSVASR
jgi:hypothetical protein